MPVPVAVEAHHLQGRPLVAVDVPPDAKPEAWITEDRAVPLDVVHLCELAGRLPPHRDATVTEWGLVTDSCV